ncbi:MAG: hypothetical protein ACRBHB_01905 [Arenicella sp.]
MSIEKINWNYISDPECENGDVVVLVQYDAAEIAKYVSPKPPNAPNEGGNFILEMCDNEDGLEEEVFNVISRQYPEIEEETENPLLFFCPAEFAQKAIWS